MKFLKILALLLISSCSATISNFPQYKVQNFPKSNFLPTKEDLRGDLPKVVVFDFNENKTEGNESNGIGRTLAVTVENVLTQKKLASLVDRQAAKKLEQEILLAELNNKKSTYKGPSVANYAVSGAVSNASFSKKYSEGLDFYTQTTGRVKTDPKYNYSADVSGNLKIYELPSMDVVENFDFSGFASRSEAVQKEGGISIGSIDIGVTKAKALEKDDGLVRKAAEDGISDIADKIKNAFAKKGYILEKRTLDNKAIFKISIGSEDGVSQGDKFEVIGKFEVENPITHEVEVENRVLATGVVSDIINPKFSFIILDDKSSNDKVRMGDVVKFKYKKSLSQKISNINRYIPAI